MKTNLPKVIMFDDYHEIDEFVKQINKVRNLFPEIPEVTGEELDFEEYDLAYGCYYGLIFVSGERPTEKEIDKMIEKVEGN